MVHSGGWIELEMAGVAQFCAKATELADIGDGNPERVAADFKSEIRELKMAPVVVHRLIEELECSVPALGGSQLILAEGANRRKESHLQDEPL